MMDLVKGNSPCPIITNDFAILALLMVFCVGLAVVHVVGMSI